MTGLPPRSTVTVTSQATDYTGQDWQPGGNLSPVAWLTWGRRVSRGYKIHLPRARTLSRYTLPWRGPRVRQEDPDGDACSLPELSGGVLTHFRLSTP